MTEKEQIQLNIGEIISLKKPHPCGGHEWRVTRLGADIGLTCLTCGRYVLLPRAEVIRRLKPPINKQLPNPRQ